MKYFDWSKKDKYDINKVFDSYMNYKSGEGSLEGFLEQVSHLAHFIVLISYSGIGSFDKEDLVAESVEKVYSLLSRNVGIFGQSLSQLHPVGFCNYLKSIINSAIRNFLDEFPLHLIDIPECEFSCSDCESIKLIYQNIEKPFKVFCDDCGSDMVLVAVRNGAIPKQIEISKEYVSDLDSYVETLYNNICEKIIKNNRFNLTEAVIKYYVSSKLQNDEVLHSCLRDVYGRSHPDEDLDNLSFLYKCAVSDIYDDYNSIKLKRMCVHEI